MFQAIVQGKISRGHSLCALVLCLSLGASLAHWFWSAHRDPWHCDALFNKGHWLDSAKRKWQPEGCMLYQYKSTEVASCLAQQRVVFVGDSITRSLFFSFMHTADPSLPSVPVSTELKHSDHSFNGVEGITFNFIWDPFLNSSSTDDLLSYRDSSQQTPFLLVLGSGLWYLRYYSSSGGFASWEAKMGTVFGTTKDADPVADHLVFLPVETLVPSKLSEDRAITMKQSDIDAMNADMKYRLLHSSNEHGILPFPSNHTMSTKLSVPFVFNSMLRASQTEDGIHYTNTIVGIQSQLLLNQICNNLLPKTPPLDKTCCRSYPGIKVLQAVILFLVSIAGPLSLFLHRYKERISSTIENYMPNQDVSLNLSIFGSSVLLMYFTDRTLIFAKEQKHFDLLPYCGVTGSAIVAGLTTATRSEKSRGFLNRDQTEEWKGWMQLMILIYHYFGASQISGIYNPIRVLVASYLFMTGYGHCSFYMKTADFGVQRITQVLVRLNLLTVVLAYVMNSTYFDYYFSPLVSFWFLVIYATMAIGHEYNARTVFLCLKIVASGAIITSFFNTPIVFNGFMDILREYLGIQWSPHEVAFRANLDIWIVYIGMLFAIGVIKSREHRLLEHRHWPRVRGAAIALSVCGICWYFYFELIQESKYTYNKWHPYISAIPILSFVVLRNATEVLRSSSSRAFIFVGKCSLETFIMQYHIWLAADTKGILFLIPVSGQRSVNFAVTSIVFLWLSHCVARATSILTLYICNTGTPKASNPELPESTNSQNLPGAVTEHQSTQGRSSWADRLSTTYTVNNGWFGGRWLLAGVGLLWILNMTWF